MKLNRGEMSTPIDPSMRDFYGSFQNKPPIPHRSIPTTLVFFVCVFFERRGKREDEVSAGRSSDDDDDDDDGRRRETTTTARRVGRELGRRGIDDGETRIGR